MTVRLTIIGNPYPADPLLDLVAGIIKDDNDTNYVRRCKSVESAGKDRGVLDTIKSVYDNKKTKIDILDIFDHGRRGRLHMGNDILFESNNSPGELSKGDRIANDIEQYLTDTAHIRLLGCSTAHKRNTLHREGRWLLLKLAEILGKHRVVFGTLAALDEEDFNEGGLVATSEVALLFSSYAALDADAPRYHERLQNIEEYIHSPSE